MEDQVDFGEIRVRRLGINEDTYHCDQKEVVYEVEALHNGKSLFKEGVSVKRTDSESEEFSAVETLLNKYERLADKREMWDWPVICLAE